MHSDQPSPSVDMAAITSLSGYVLVPLRQAPDVSLFRAQKIDKAEQFLVLTLSSLKPSRSSTLRLEHEYSLRDELDSSWAIRPLSLIQEGERTVVLLEDPRGDSLEAVLGLPFEPGRFLKLAILMAASLDQVHGRGLIHKDVKPAHVFVSPTGEVRLTGFGIASRLPRERQTTAVAPEVIAGTFAYMAPEQTGRMNRLIDKRSDLYSLGIVFYEMLTGELPFLASSPMEWIHCHIARQPLPPSKRTTGIPAQLDRIILKLLAKMAEDRYQSASGLKGDLQRCLIQWEQAGEIELFPLGFEDAPERLSIPEKLYGRETDVNALTDAFDRVRTLGSTEFALLSGYSGIGKSSIVNELHRALVTSEGLFAGGKADRYKQDIPYATLAQAFRGVMSQLLSLDDAELGRWRQALVYALEDDGRLIVNLIPDLALIVGYQPEMPEIPPQETQIRFQLAFKRFVSVFAREKRPLVLFLDDLQWLDTATFDMLERLAIDPDANNLLIIGAYRDTEVGSSHALSRTLDIIGKSGKNLTKIGVEQLKSTDVARLIGDALSRDQEEVMPLAALTMEKTAGNPLFVIQFVTALADEGLLWFDRNRATWMWDAEQISTRAIPDNVAELLAAKFGRYSDETLDALTKLACIGTKAEAHVLAQLLDTTESRLELILRSADAAGHIRRTDGAYAFVHDRVREAAYSFINDDTKRSVHLQIGQILAADITTIEMEENVFEIVNHLNRGVSLLQTTKDRIEVAKLNLLAGKRAKTATAYDLALAYFGVGCELMSEDGWSHSNQIRFELEFHRADCEFLTGNVTSSASRFARLAERADNLASLATVVCRQITLFTHLRELERAVNIGIECLRGFGFVWSAHPTVEQVRNEYQCLCDLMNGREIEDLLDQPLMVDASSRSLMQLMEGLAGPAGLLDRDLFALVILRMTNYSIEHGASDESCLAYVSMGRILGQVIGDSKAGYRFAQLGVDMVRQRGLDGMETRVYASFSHLVNPWTEHIREGYWFACRATEVGLKRGHLTWTAFAWWTRGSILFDSGASLLDTEAELQMGLTFARKWQLHHPTDLITTPHRLVRSLRGLTVNLGSFEDAGFREAEYEAYLETTPELASAAAKYWTRKLQAIFYSRDLSKCDFAIQKVEETLHYAWLTFETAEFHFFSALCYLSTFFERSARGESPMLLIGIHRHRLAEWAKSCRANYTCRLLLVDAEIARVNAEHLSAQQLYESAIQNAETEGFLQVQALSNELSAEYHASLGLHTAAEAYLRDAHYCYRQWGANGKVRQIEALHPGLSRPTSISSEDDPDVTTTTGLDLGTVFRMSQVISGEIEPDKLMEKLMVLALENAGADRGVLTLVEESELQIEAEAATTGNLVEVKIRRSSLGTVELPISMLRYVQRTRETLMLEDASQQNSFSTDPYISKGRSRSILCLPLIKQASLIGVMYLENRKSSRVFTAAHVEVLELLASQAAISMQNARVYAALQKTKTYLAESQTLSQTGSFSWKLESKIIQFSDEMARIYEFDNEKEVSLDRMLVRVHPEDRSFVKDFIDRLSTNGLADGIEHRLSMPNGSVKFLKVIARKHGDKVNGQILIGTAIDISQTKLVQEHLRNSIDTKEALLKEVHHRVKNNLQLISSLLNLQSARIADPAVAELFNESRNRVRSMALVHENLYRAGDFARISMAEHVQTLCMQLSRVYGLQKQNVQLTAVIDEMDLDIDQAIPIGLIVNELVSNALKHAFPGGRSGHVHVSLESLAGRRRILTVRDDGIGFSEQPEEHKVNSLGLQLVQTLTLQLHGVSSVQRHGGTLYSLQFEANDNGSERRLSDTISGNAAVEVT